MTNEAKDEVPEWAQEAAAKIAAEAIELHTNQEIEGLSQEIARALLSAERRGIERAATVADQRVALASKIAPEAAAALFVALPDAIRRLGEAE